MQTCMTAKNHNCANKTMYQITTSTHNKVHPQYTEVYARYLLGNIAMQSQALGNTVSQCYTYALSKAAHTQN